jgi:hypothetical protein
MTQTRTDRPTPKTDAELLAASPARVANWYRGLTRYVRSLPEDVQWTMGADLRRYAAAFRTVGEAPRRTR